MSKNQSAVLIAEDNAEIAKLIKIYLEGEGYKTVWESNHRFHGQSSQRQIHGF